jgi:hypothetical protein
LRFGQTQVNQGLGVASQALTDQLESYDQRLAAQNSASSANLRRMVQDRMTSLRRSAEEMQDEALNYERAQEDISLEMLGDTQSAEFIRAGVQRERQFQDQNRDLIRSVRDAQEAITAAEAAKNEILTQVQDFRTQAAQLGVDPATIEAQATEMLSAIPGLDSFINNTQTELNRFQGVLNDAQTLFDRQNDIATEAYAQQQALQRAESLRQSAALMLQERAAQAGLEGNEIGVQVIQTRGDIMGIGDRYAEQMRPLEEQLKRIRDNMEAIDGQGLNLNPEQLTLAQQEATHLSDQLDALTQQRDIEIRIAQTGLEQVRQQLEDTLQQDTVEASATYLENNRDTFGAAQVREQYAFEQENERFGRQMSGIDALEESTQFSAEQIAALRSEAETLNALNLENIDSQFKDLGETLETIGQESLGQFFNDILTGSKSAGEAFKDLISNILSQLAQLAVNALLKDLFGGGGGLPGQQAAGGGGIGGVLSGIFGAGQQAAGAAVGGGGGGLGGGLAGTILNIGASLIGGFAEGGEVDALNHSSYRKGYGAISEALQREGNNAVLAALTPGEEVLTVAQARRYRELGMDDVLNFKSGGTVGMSAPRIQTSGMAAGGKRGGDVNVPVTVNVSGEESSVDIPAFRQIMESQIQATIQKEKRPGGSLSRS